MLCISEIAMFCKCVYISMYIYTGMYTSLPLKRGHWMKTNTNARRECQKPPAFHVPTVTDFSELRLASSLNNLI